MKKIIILIIVMAGIINEGLAQFPSPPGRAKKITITCSEPDASIIVNRTEIGKGIAEIKVAKDASVTVKVQKTGYVSLEKTFFNTKDQPASYNFEMERDVLKITCSEADASIFANGTEIGKGNAEITLPADGAITVKVMKIGFATEERVFYKSQNPPKTYHFILFKDDSYDASSSSDIANVDVDIKTSKAETEAWRLLSQIITSYFDVIEVSDKETGYLRTSWELQQFNYNTIRTRIIVKLGNSNPIEYKVKLVSECSDKPGTSVKSDELFKQWDRVLRKYENIIPEIQSRLK
jgi:hypothetical protein